MGKASAWWVSAFLVCVACSGDDFTSGGGTGGQNAGGQTSGGSGGTGATATGGVAGTPVGGSGGVAGVPPPTGGAAGVVGTGGSAGANPINCEYGAEGECPPGYYCEAPGCQAGICKLKPEDEDGSLQPACGCDGITYWNKSVASKHGESVKSAGACNLTGQHCPSGSCPGQAKCNKTVLSQALCGGTDFISECWMLPEGCAGADAPFAHGCVSSCKSVCKLIDMGEEYYGSSCN